RPAVAGLRKTSRSVGGALVLRPVEMRALAGAAEPAKKMSDALSPERENQSQNRNRPISCKISPVIRHQDWRLGEAFRVGLFGHFDRKGRRGAKRFGAIFNEKIESNQKRSDRHKRVARDFRRGGLGNLPAYSFAERRRGEPNYNAQGEIQRKGRRIEEII
ncbi:MAG TPA: hypothetical protein VNH64_11805, partial [Parvularculaceae bacterium]|nr:hypothetical protein [Parvularculaceae bacterium]